MDYVNLSDVVTNDGSFAMGHVKNTSLSKVKMKTTFGYADRFLDYKQLAN